MKLYNSIGNLERMAVDAAMHGPLSGYLAGKPRGGPWVVLLESKWQDEFHVKHAIACNSATSGLLAAAFAIGLKPGDEFICPAMTMSATAAAPMFTGATPWFADVEDKTFNADWKEFPFDRPIFTTNLFGHPSELHAMRHWCDSDGTFLVEDNSQSPFAMERGRYAGTIGHIGIFSLNVHKPLQCGEGGMITTDDDMLAERLRDFINHGENRGGPIGLNLRMPEVCAAIASAQLDRANQILSQKVEQAMELLYQIGDIPGLRRPETRDGCTNVYYTIPFVVEKGRDAFLDAMALEGVPLEKGYIDPLYRMPAFKEFAVRANGDGSEAAGPLCPMAEGLHDRRLFYFENCAWDLTCAQIKKIGEKFRRVWEKLA